jgi:hypothetical protein
MRSAIYKLLPVIVLACSPLMLLAQTKGKPKSTSAKPATEMAKPTPSPEVPTPGLKRNERPSGGETKSNAREASSTTNAKYIPVYFYEFSRPGFVYDRIAIEHDESGTGTITFEKGGFNEAVTDPINLSAATLDKLKAAFTALNFLDSVETYQTARDYSHMGNTTIKMARGGRTREAKYNWTDNKDAKFLMDEYRRVGNEYTWRFEMESARDNQPLLTPGLVDLLDSYLRRSEISDPSTLLPFLTKLSTDERLPLMARNHTSKLIAQIEKNAKK